MSTTKQCLVPGCERPHRAQGYCTGHYKRLRSRSPRPGFAERFWAKVNKDGPTMPHMDTPCWVWCAHLNRSGYGTYRFGGRAGGVTWLTHRLSWRLETGADPGSQYVLHQCDNPPCVNPAHLHLGTAADNAREMRARGREPRGERQAGAKLNDGAVIAIRTAWASGGHTLRSLAREYGVSDTAIQHVTSGRTWTHLLDHEDAA